MVYVKEMRVEMSSDDDEEKVIERILGGATDAAEADQNSAAEDGDDGDENNEPTPEGEGDGDGETAAKRIRHATSRYGAANADDSDGEKDSPAKAKQPTGKRGRGRPPKTTGPKTAGPKTTGKKLRGRPKGIAAKGGAAGDNAPYAGGDATIPASQIEINKELLDCYERASSLLMASVEDQNDRASKFYDSFLKKCEDAVGS